MKIKNYWRYEMSNPEKELKMPKNGFAGMLEKEEKELKVEDGWATPEKERGLRVPDRWAESDNDK